MNQIANIFDRLGRGTSVTDAVLSGLGPGMHPRISIRGGQFAVIDAVGQRYGAPVELVTRPNVGQVVVLRAIVLAANPLSSRIFFKAEYDPDNPGPPDCYSDNGTAPSASASSPQARTCDECQWKKWGSDVSKLTGKKTKACSEKKKLGVILINDPTSFTYEMQVPPASLKNMAKYVTELKSYSPPGTSRPANINDMVTAISFMPGQTGILEFLPYSWLTSAYVDEQNTVRVVLDAQGGPGVATDQGQSIADRIENVWESATLDAILGLNDVAWTPPALSGPLPGMVGYLEPQQRGAVDVAGPAPGPAGPNPYSPPAGAQPQRHQPQIAFNQPAQGFALPGQPAPAPLSETAQPPGQSEAAPRKPRTRTPAPAAQLPASQQAAPAQAAPAQAAPVPQQGTIVTDQDIPAFLRRSDTPPASTAAPAPKPQFGLQQGAAPGAALQEAVTAAFKLRTS